MTRKKSDIKPVVAILLIVAIAGAAFGVRSAVAGGDMGCLFAQDPALCVAVKGVGER